MFSLPKFTHKINGNEVRKNKAQVQSYLSSVAEILAQILNQSFGKIGNEPGWG